MKKLLFTLSLLISLFVLISCASSPKDSAYPNAIAWDVASSEPNAGHETYEQIKENSFVETEKESSVYFSMDSNTSSYSNLRRMINEGYLNNLGNAIRTDELLNYFDYDFNNSDLTFTSHAEISKCPWNQDNYLLTVGIKTRETTVENYSQGNNYVFLIDVSGSMQGENRIGLVKKSFNMLVDTLSDNDTVSIVTYASNEKIVLEGAKGANKEAIKRAINNLVANGSTYAQKGLQTAYEIAAKYFINGGNNRILIASDGDFNAGISDPVRLKEFIQDKAKSGVYISALGFGMGNYRDDMMRAIAQNGNGIFAYIDSIEEAKRVLIDKADNTFCVVAQDVKSKLEFNPELVSEYRLIGYENKTMSEIDYQNDQTDAGELGSNTTTMICVELKLTEAALNDINGLFKLNIKYKDPETLTGIEYIDTFIHLELKDFEETTEDHKFASCVVAFSLILRDSKYKGQADITETVNLLSSLNCVKEDEYKAEFLSLVKKTFNL